MLLLLCVSIVWHKARPRVGFSARPPQAGWKSVSRGGGGSILGFESSSGPGATAPPLPASLVQPPWHYSREGGSSEAENGDQAQAHAGLVPAILGTFTKHVPYPLAGAVGAAGEVAGAQFLPDHDCGGRAGGRWSAEVGKGSKGRKRGGLQFWGGLGPSCSVPNLSPSPSLPSALTEPLHQRTVSLKYRDESKPGPTTCAESWFCSQGPVPSRAA